jgi:hypothetical protein
MEKLCEVMRQWLQSETSEILHEIALPAAVRTVFIAIEIDSGITASP